MSEADFLWKALVVLSVIVSVVATPIALLINSRRRPTLTEELYRDFATKQDLAALRSEMMTVTGEIFSVTRKLKDEATALVGHLNRLDGILSRCPGPTECGHAKK